MQTETSTPLTSRRFWMVTIDRAIRTAAQAAALAGVAVGTGIADMDLLHAISMAAGGFLASVVTSVALPPSEATTDD